MGSLGSTSTRLPTSPATQHAGLTRHQTTHRFTPPTKFTRRRFAIAIFPLSSFLLLTLYRENVDDISSPGGMFCFHAASDAFGTALLWASYPAKVRARLGALTTRVVYVRADELVEKCE